MHILSTDILHTKCLLLKKGLPVVLQYLKKIIMNMGNIEYITGWKFDSKSTIGVLKDWVKCFLVVHNAKLDIFIQVGSQNLKTSHYDDTTKICPIHCGYYGYMIVVNKSYLQTHRQ